jgi:catechol 2,3-dioxygenase-like lactoylglutathione lyase family enzyme
MEPRLSLVTLGVTDLEQSSKFYRDVLKLPCVHDSPEIVFFELGTLWLSLFPRECLAADAGVPAEGSGFRGFTLAHNVRSEAEVDALIAEAVAGGATLVKAGQKAEWGGYSGYFADPDGFLWEVAWNPHFPHV